MCSTTDSSLVFSCDLVLLSKGMYTTLYCTVQLSNCNITMMVIYATQQPNSLRIVGELRKAYIWVFAIWSHQVSICISSNASYGVNKYIVIWGSVRSGSGLSEEKIPSGFKSTPNIIFSIPQSSLVTQLSENVWHVYSQNEWLRRYMIIWQSIWSKLASWSYSGITLDIKVFSLWRTS